MAAWRFYQGLRAEWRWYHFDDAGRVIAESDQGFAELRACMANAETAGFTGDTYQVHARHGGKDMPGSAEDEDDIAPPGIRIRDKASSGSASA